MGLARIHWISGGDILDTDRSKHQSMDAAKTDLIEKERRHYESRIKHSW